MNERRSVPRVAPQEPLKAKVHASFPVRVLDISERGAQIEVERSLRPNVGCELRFPAPEGELVMRATVRRCRAWGFVLSEADQRVLVFRAGVEFDRPDPELLRRLRLAATEEAPGRTGSPVLKDALSGETGLPGETVAPAAEVPATAAEGEPVPAPPLAVATPPRGPVKIRIRSDHVRRILLS